MASSDELRALWKRVDAHLRAALSVVDVGVDERRWVDEYLDHNELGLAFQTLVCALADRGTAAPASAHEHLAAAAGEMRLEDDADWRRLRVMQ